VCHSDLHTVRDEWQGTLFPCVPGHEIVGHVEAVGDAVTGFESPRVPWRPVGLSHAGTAACVARCR
jgi:D-arabinose 1-dehydrogenase-like Zn-dependent alcohol dehydrogenase